MFQFIKRLFGVKREPEHLRRGRLGEAAAKRHLKSTGLKFLVANFKTKDSEIDLVFRDDDCPITHGCHNKTSYFNVPKDTRSIDTV